CARRLYGNYDRYYAMDYW
nr:immunoglobulin heavy chain junction region [Mus musculus]MBK4184948.1 immunoglobulin heavy chain junction region [Mus musculus]